MKDDKLEKEFEEYFKGAGTPDNITGDAKRYVKPKTSFMPKFVKFASVAASIVLVFAVALTIIFRAGFNKADPDASLGTSNSPTVPSYAYYTDADLTNEAANAYTISSLDKSLKFIENLAVAGNVSVKECKAGYRNGKLALARASVTATNGLNRDETEIYVEFTDEKTIYGGLADYLKGKKYYYRGAEYYLTQSVAENKEPQFKLHVTYRGVKYYFSVTSSDEDAYKKYLNLIVK